MTDDVFAVIAEATRRDILVSLRKGDKAVGELVQELEASQPTISKHLKVLREADLVSMRAQGQKRYYALNPKPLAGVASWLETFDVGPADRSAAGASPRRHPARLPDSRVPDSLAAAAPLCCHGCCRHCCFAASGRGVGGPARGQPAQRRRRHSGRAPGRGQDAPAARAHGWPGRHQSRRPAGQPAEVRPQKITQPTRNRFYAAQNTCRYRNSGRDRKSAQRQMLVVEVDSRPRPSSSFKVLGPHWPAEIPFSGCPIRNESRHRGERTVPARCGRIRPADGTAGAAACDGPCLHRHGRPGAGGRAGRGRRKCPGRGQPHGQWKFPAGFCRRLPPRWSGRSCRPRRPAKVPTGTVDLLPDYGNTVLSTDELSNNILPGAFRPDCAAVDRGHPLLPGGLPR